MKFKIGDTISRLDFDNKRTFGKIENIKIEDNDLFYTVNEEPYEFYFFHKDVKELDIKLEEINECFIFV